MPPVVRASAKASTSARRTSADSDVAFIIKLSDPTKCDEHSVHRLAKALEWEVPAAVKRTTQRKRDSMQRGCDVGEKRKLAMRTANAVSQCLWKVVQSGWKGTNPKATPGVSMESVLSAVSSFRIAIAFLRNTGQCAIDVERVASGFIGKLITLQLYEPALEILDELRANIIRYYNDSPSSALQVAVTRSTSKRSLTKYLHLVQYPRPAPEEPMLLALISTSLSQALLALAGMMQAHPPKDAFVEEVAAVIEGSDGPISWSSWLFTEHADALMTRVHRMLVMTFSSSNTSSNLLLRLRALALKSLLHRSTLDRDPFWSQATNYMASHGKDVIRTEDVAKAVNDVVTYFKSIVLEAKKRHDATTFMSGPAFLKFCDVALIFAKRGDIASLNVVTQFLNTDLSDHNTSREDHANIELHAILRRASAILDKYRDRDIESDVISSLLKCTELISRSLHLLSEESSSQTLNCMERLRRSCLNVLNTPNCEEPVKGAVKTLILTIVRTMEHCTQQQKNADFTANIVDSLCNLAKIELLQEDAATYATTFEFLQSALKLVDARSVHKLAARVNGNVTSSSAKLMHALAGGFWNSAVFLYQNGKYAIAIRFLVHACALSVKACDRMQTEANDSSASEDMEGWKNLKSQLPTRWELLGDCYSKIGDRRLAHNAFLESLKSYSFEALRHSATCSSPNDILADATNRRLASLVERITYIAVFDLMMKGEASLRRTLCTLGVDREAIGIILEWEMASLEHNLWKSEVPLVLHCLLRDVLDIYGPDFPMRRTRVLIQKLDLAYRTDDSSVPVDQIMAEIQDLLSQDPGKDATFVELKSRYMATAHIWTVLHAHRRSQGNSHTVTILRHATSASKILRSIFPSPPISGPPKSPKRPSKVVVKKAIRTGTRVSPRKKSTGISVNPVTPKQHNLSTQTPPRLTTCEAQSPKSSSPKYATSLADSLIINIQTVAQLMGLLGHVVLKLQFLNILQRMSGRSSGLSADVFVRASIDAADVYVRLGKTQRGMAIYEHALAAVDSTAAAVSDEARVMLFLRFAASHALNGTVQQSLTLYEKARILAQNMESPQSNSTADRIRSKVQVLEQSALASNVFAAIQIARDDPHAAFSTLRQSLRLWNRALDALSRLAPSSPSNSSDPFDMTSLAETLPMTSESVPRDSLVKGSYHWSTFMVDVQWRIADGILYTLFDLGRAHFVQGTVRGSEYYIDQAYNLTQGLHSPNLLCRALAKKGELQLRQGKLEDAANTLLGAFELSRKTPGIDAADVNRLRAHYNQLMDNRNEAEALYLETVQILSELERALIPVENVILGPRRSSLTSSSGKSHHVDVDVLAPGFLATVLRQRIWLKRNEPQDETKALLDQMSALPPSRETQAEERMILAKLALHGAQVQFRTDLFLSSLTESTIALPMGASSLGGKPTAGGRRMLETLSNAEKMFWDSLKLVGSRGHASDVREVVMSLALIQSFQTTLGKASTTGARVVASLLDASATITLRREFISEIDNKFLGPGNSDLTWPTTHSGLSATSHVPEFSRSVESVEDTGLEDSAIDLKAYWRSVRERCYSSHNLGDQASSQIDLPAHWTVVSISITEDKNTMFFSRRRHATEPLIFCVPLERHSRKEDPAERFSYWDAVGQLRGILQQSDASAQGAKDISSQDRDAKVAWWAKRTALDRQLRELLENIEFCWLGAFKTILSEPYKILPHVLDEFRVRLENVFKRNLASDKRRMSRIKLDNSLMECFATLSPKCRDEELEDLIYFFLDLYQFHGIHVALSELDMDQLLVELRTELEEHASKSKGAFPPMENEHLFLVLDKNVQGIPWESIPILRGRSVSRVPSLSFLVDRIEFAKLQWERGGAFVKSPDRTIVNPRKTFYVLNPGGDLNKSESRFKAWTEEMEAFAGWQGIVGQVPSEQQLLNAFSKKDLVIYFGHGGAEQYIRSHKIKQLQRCAATMLWGCSSGLLREMGEFERVGTPYNYMLAGCPTLVACLWDVTDNELDKISRSVFDRLRLNPEHVKSWSTEPVEAPVSVITAVGRSRDACKLKYLTGAAPVVYGIPFYL